MRRDLTPPERKLWGRLQAEQLGAKFRKQHPIGPYIADFFCWEKGLVIECDGDSHYSDAGLVYDQERDDYLTGLGLTVLRFANTEVSQNLEGVLHQITQTLTQTIPSEDHYRQWRRADSLAVGDVVFWGPSLEPVAITQIWRQETEEEVYDLEVEHTHSFITAVCAIHNCGSGTSAAGRRS